jgi:heme oxygenase (mycobilin-producing)
MIYAVPLNPALDRFIAVEQLLTEDTMMAISVLIQRTFSDMDKAEKLAPLIVKIRSLAPSQPGYITGRTFRCLDCPGEYLVISTWNSLDDWHRWLRSEQRMAFQKQVDDLLGDQTHYRIYESLVGGILPKFQAATE